VFGVKPSDLRNNPWWRKTRMLCLSDEAFSRFDTIHACDRRTDGQTDRPTDRRTEMA